MDESFDAMLRAIQEATRSVRLEMYIYSPGRIAEMFRDRLVEAAGRGLEVKVLIDAWGSVHLSDDFWEPLRQAGGEARWFNPLQLRCCGFRDHRKLLVCDEQVAFVGGFNISSEYQGDGIHRGWHDLGLQITGALAQELADSFESLYAMADFRHRPFAALRRSALRKIISTPDGQIVLAAPGRGHNFFKQSLIIDLLKAKSARIISAYFLPTRPVRRALIRLARRGGKVQLILAGKTDVTLSQLASRKFYDPFLRAGIEIFEYQPQVLHAKLILIDDVVYVGSANLDQRSFSINYELIVRLARPELAREGQAIFERDLELSRPIDAQSWRASRSIWQRFIEHCAFFILARIDPYIARRQWKVLR